MNDSVLARIRELLRAEGVKFTEKEHAPTYTSEESAAARGEALGVGAKALLLKTDEIFRLFVLPADKKLDSAAIKRELKVKKIRFASAEELHALTGLPPGSVPPFGPPILPFDLYADDSLGTAHGRIAFNAGSLTNSIIMSAADWEALVRPSRFSFGK
jgi:Ala-tRNA(Pro) deacylase